HCHWILFARLLVRRYLILTGNHQPDCSCNIRGTHAQIGSALTVDLYLEFRTVDVQIHVYIRKSRSPFQLGMELSRIFPDFLQIRAEHSHVDSGVALAFSERGRPVYARANARVLSHDLPDVFGDIFLREVAFGDINESNISV